jgi:ferritin-like metal-binding protein YciE
VEHYEIALYGTLAAFAGHLGLQGAAGPLEDTLKEEKAADAQIDANWRNLNESSRR